MSVKQRLSLKLNEESKVSIDAPENHVGQVEFEMTPWVLQSPSVEKQNVVGKQTTSGPKYKPTKIMGQPRNVRVMVRPEKNLYNRFHENLQILR